MTRAACRGGDRGRAAGARDDIAYQTPPPWLNALFSALPALLACLALWRLSPKRALLVCLALLVAVLAASLLLLSQAICGSPQRGAAGRRAQLPMWSWRSQEAALRYMDYELRRLQREYPPVLNEAARSPSATAPRSNIASAN